MLGDGPDAWLGVRSVQLCPQISLTSIYKLIHAGGIPAARLGSKTIRVNREAFEKYLQRAQVASALEAARRVYRKTHAGARDAMSPDLRAMPARPWERIWEEFRGEPHISGGSHVVVGRGGDLACPKRRPAAWTRTGRGR